MMKLIISVTFQAKTFFVMCYKLNLNVLGSLLDKTSNLEVSRRAV